jgi:hypothetical protein
MDYNIIKILPVLKSPIAWLYALFSDQTRLSLCGKEHAGNPTDKLLIQASDSAEGILSFSISTKSKDRIEIKEINFDYAAFAQFTDPQSMGFFKNGRSNNADFPFRLCWSGSAFIERNTSQLFAVSVKANNIRHEQPIRIKIYAQRHKNGLSGFPSLGRIQIHKFIKAIAFTDKPIGHIIPPKSGITSEQPFIIQGAITVIAPTSGAHVLVHEEEGNGQVSSREIKL